MIDSNLLPGRLGDDARRFETDQRADPRIAEVVRQIGGFGGGLEAPGPDASYERCLDYCQQFEDVNAQAHPEMFANMPSFDSVAVSEETIGGVDGNEIVLHIHQPKLRNGALPCIVHIHGGGMVLMTATDPGTIRWRNILAEQGIVVIGVEYRNGGGTLGNHPFPAGLNDCAAAMRWAHSQRQRFDMASLTLSGESGGGNLSIATALKANQEGWIDEIDGVYALCPYIYGGYADPVPELLSLQENDDYMLGKETMATMVKVYDPSNANANNPLAWPYHARANELKGLPPHVISVNELDPLRDEGLAFYRKLLQAGVTVSARTVNGTPHGGDMGFVDIAPEITADTVASIAAFVRAR
jgi:acetyl esterase